MRRRMFIVVFIVSIFHTFAQSVEEDRLKELFENGDYSRIIEEYGSQEPAFSAISLYYIGVAYMMNEDDEKCIKYMDLSITKNSLDPAPYYLKATSSLYLNKLTEAIPDFQKAIDLESDNEKLVQSYMGLGYALYQLQQYNQALEIYNKAISCNNIIPTPYLIKAQIYYDLNKEDLALETYYEGKKNIPEDIPEYITVLYNIGLLEQMNGNYKEAEASYKEVINIVPDDFHTYAKLIQIYYHNKEYSKAVPLKEKLYVAHEQGLLNEHLEDMFCIDQFSFKDKLIRVFERYEQGNKENIYNKLIFYIVDSDENIEFQIQMEYSPIAAAFGDTKYILCANKNGAHINYGIGFSDNADYDSIKNTVISILEKEYE